MCRYEFAANEFVSCVVSVPLETMSTESGMKDFIAVGTTINRGEDLAVKGAVRTTSCAVEWRPRADAWTCSCMLGVHL